MLPIIRYKIQDKRLRPFIKRIWYLETEEPRSIAHQLLPSSDIDVILNLSGHMAYQTEDARFSAAGFHVNGIRSQSAEILQEGRLRVWGITFFSFGLYPFLGIPLTDMNHQIVNLQDCSKALNAVLQNLLWSERHFNRIPEKIEGIFLSLLVHEVENKREIERIRLFAATPPEVSIREFCSSHNIQEKTLERNFLRYTGYTPQRLRRIDRFQLTCNQLVFSKDVKNLSDFAQEQGYYDQSHFIREFKQFTKSSPKEFIREKKSVKEHTQYFQK